MATSESAHRRWKDVFSFALIRDPYARMVSLYHYQLKVCEAANGCERYLLPRVEAVRRMKRNVTAAAAFYPTWLRRMDAAYQACDVTYLSSS